MDTSFILFAEIFITKQKIILKHSTIITKFSNSTKEQYPNIHYFKDGGGVYLFNSNEQPVYVIPGAYSVDKNFRLATGKKWFRDEQLTEEEKETLVNLIDSVIEFDEISPIVLSHTCPLCWEDHINYLFMDELDQDSIDKTMEKFLDKVYTRIWYKHWYFGHFHDDKDFRDIKATILFEKVIPFGEYIDMEEEECIQDL